MNLKKITALTIAFSCLTTIVPTTLSIGSVPVYAASKGDYLSDIALETNKGKKVYVCTKESCDSKYRISKLDDDDQMPLTLYAKVASNVSKVNFDSITVDSGYTYKIFKGSDEIEEDEDVKLSSKTTTFKIKVYKDGETKELETYSLKVSKESDDDDDDDSDDYDDIYLDDLTMTNSNGKKVSFTFKKSTSTYDINVANDITYVKICAEPDEDDYKVKIDGNTVDEDDDWTKKVTLSEGKNSIPVKIKDDDDNERTYTLNITRASKTQSSTDTNTNTNTNTNNGSSNNTVKPSPNTSAPTFPTTKLGWVAQGSNWYFVQPDGKAATGWLQSPYSLKWFYMDPTTGVMKTGWVQVPTNNKWYYFYSNGDMATNTTIGGYKLGSDGAWIQ
ncbi:MAG: cadherin-like beta sandwich domain-containing protein [Clostridium sp.]|nr:cadherin-like beta sandwich domain-containing protein [Clostridium sp.]